jgi:hypothetical protein
VRSCGTEKAREREREREKWRASTLTLLRCSCGGCLTAGSSGAAARRAPEVRQRRRQRELLGLGFRAAETAAAGWGG